MKASKWCCVANLAAKQNNGQSKQQTSEGQSLFEQ
jgi:hypothetical protein